MCFNKNQTFRVIGIFIGLFVTFPVIGKLVIYPAPSGATLNNEFIVLVRETGTIAWLDLAEYSATVIHRIGSTEVGKPNTSFVYFDTSDSVDIKIKWNGSSVINKVRIRPLSYNITPVVDTTNKTITLSIAGPKYLVVDINEDIYRNLQIFANPIETNPPGDTDPDVTYIHTGTIHNGDIHLKDGKTLYIAGGAIVKGCVYADNTTGAKILGRGMIYQPSYDAISAKYVNNLTVDGIIEVNYGWGNNGGCAFRLGQGNNVTIRNLKVFSCNKWGDGIDMFCSSNVTVDNAFLRTGDDAICVYGTVKGEFKGDNYNIKVTNSVLWNDIARPIHLGVYGDDLNDGNGNIYRDITFKNIDVLEQNEYKVGSSGVIALTVGGKNYLSDIRFEDIRIEDLSLGKLLHFVVYYMSTYNKAPGRGINGIYLKNISFNDINANPSTIAGYDSLRITQNIIFENLRINGKLILNADSGNIKIGPYTKNIRFYP
jgi:hypothetical protein